MATIIRTHSEKEEELLELFCKCLERMRWHGRTPYAIKVLKKALELFVSNSLINVVEKNPDSRIDWFQLARVKDLPTIPFVDNGPSNTIDIVGPLEAAGVESFVAMLAIPEKELLGPRFYGFGPAHLRTLKKVLRRCDLELGQEIKGLEDEPWPEEESKEE